MENQKETEKNQKLQIQKKLEDMEKKYNELQIQRENEHKELNDKTENYELKINENELEKSKLNKKIDELENILKEKEEMNKINEKELLNIKKINDEKEKSLNAKIEMIEENYKKKFDEEFIKVKKNLIKTNGDNLKKIKNKFNDLYESKEKALDEKFNKLNNSGKNLKLDLDKKPNFELPKNENKNIKLINRDNNINDDNQNNEKRPDDNINNQNDINNINKQNDINNQNDINKLINNIPKDEDKIYTNEEEEINVNQKNNDNIILDKINDLNNDNENNENKDEREYSYDCINSMFLSIYIYQGTDKVDFEIYLKNSGNKTWANDSKLLVDPTSKCKVDEIILDPQKPDTEKGYPVTIKDLKNYPEGEYKIIFWFYSGGKIHGEKIVAIIRIKEKDEKKNEIDENIDKIQEFRDTFNLSEDEYPNEKILEILKENDFNYENAFSSLFN